MRYRRALVEGATYFFTVNLANRSSRLLVDRVHDLRETVRGVRRAHPFEIIAWVRHEVARIFIRETCAKTGHSIGCSAARTLPGRASGVTLGCEAPGTL